MSAPGTEFAPVMIGGCGSSGTSLLSHLLNCSDRFYCGPEWYLLYNRELYTKFSSFSHEQKKTLITKGLTKELPLKLSANAHGYGRKVSITTLFFHSRYRNQAGISDHQAFEWSLLSHTFCEFIETIGRWLLKKAGKERWAEKTPLNCHAIGTFLEHFPKGLYVHVIRDGRDVVLSLRQRGFTLRNGLQRWLYDSAQILPFQDHNRCFVLKYETLVSNPIPSLNALLLFLGENTAQSTAMLARATENPIEQAERVNLEAWRHRVNDPISIRSLNKWKAETEHNKKRLKSLFAHVTLKPDVCEKLGLEYPITGQRLLSSFGYPVLGEWHALPTQHLSISIRKSFDRVTAYDHPYCEWLR